MARRVVTRLADFTEEHPVLMLSLCLLFGILALLFILTLGYSLIFFHWLGL